MERSCWKIDIVNQKWYQFTSSIPKNFNQFWQKCINLLTYHHLFRITIENFIIFFIGNNRLESLNRIKIIFINWFWFNSRIQTLFKMQHILYRSLWSIPAVPHQTHQTDLDLATSCHQCGLHLWRMGCSLPNRQRDLCGAEFCWCSLWLHIHLWQWQ